MLLQYLILQEHSVYLSAVNFRKYHITSVSRCSPVSSTTQFFSASTILPVADITPMPPSFVSYWVTAPTGTHGIDNLLSSQKGNLAASGAIKKLSLHIIRTPVKQSAQSSRFPEPLQELVLFYLIIAPIIFAHSTTPSPVSPSAVRDLLRNYAISALPPG